MKAKKRKIAVAAVLTATIALVGGFIVYRSREADTAPPAPERPINVSEPDV